MASSIILGPVFKRSLRQDVAGRMITAIFRGDLKGGELLVEGDLASRFAVSRTPVREAISELASVGMVEMRLGRSAIIREFGPDQLRDIYHVRAVLEAEATQRACGRIDPHELQVMHIRMNALLSHQVRDTAWTQETMLADRQFHELVANGCDNPRLREEISRYRKLVQAVREIIENRSSALKQALAEHLDIQDRLLAQDDVGAGKAMRNHVEEAAKAAIEDVFPAKVGQSVVQGWSDRPG